MEQREKIEKSEARAGDVIFFKGSDFNSTKAGHVEIVVSVKDSTV